MNPAKRESIKKKSTMSGLPIGDISVIIASITAIVPMLTIHGNGSVRNDANGIAYCIDVNFFHI